MADQPAGERCGTCRFWDADSTQKLTDRRDDGSGACRRLPPVVNDLYTEALWREAAGKSRDDIRPHHAATGVFPMTDTNDWCGEYRATELDYGPDGH